MRGHLEGEGERGNEGSRHKHTDMEAGREGIPERLVRGALLGGSRPGAPWFPVFVDRHSVRVFTGNAPNTKASTGALHKQHSQLGKGKGLVYWKLIPDSSTVYLPDVLENSWTS